MRTTPGTKSNRAQGNSKDNRKGFERSTRLPERRLPSGGRKRTAKAAASRAHRSHLLSLRFKPVGVHIIDDGSIFDNTKYSPENIPTALVNLYHCLRHHPKFKDDKQWDKQPSMLELKQYLFGELWKLCPNGTKPHYNYDDDGKLRLRFIKYLEKLEGAYSLPVEWIPEIQKKNGELFTLITAVLSVVADRWYLDVIRNNYNDWLIEDPEGHFEDYEDDEDIRRSVQMYQKDGAAENYRELLKKYAKRNSKRQLTELVTSFKPTGKLEKEIKAWLEKGLIALNNPRSIGMYYFPGMNDDFGEEPINVNDMYNLSWSFRDQIFSYAEDHMNSTAGNFGVCPPAVCTEFFPDKKPSVDDGEKELEALRDFMEAGRQIYWKHFDAHFEKWHKDPNYKARLTNIL